MSADKKLAGKVALITGAGSGIGRATALLFAREGADIAVNDIDLPSAEKTAEDVRKAGRQAIAVQADVAQPAAVEKMVDTVIKKMGGIHILVNNAGIPVHGTLLEAQTVEAWEKVIGVILRGTYLCSRAAGKWMVEHRTGKVVNISSRAGIIGAPGMASYGAGKAAVINLTRTLAREWGQYGICVNAIAPGLIDTPLTRRTLAKDYPDAVIREVIPLQRMGTAEEIAAAALFLASDDSSYITGITIPVDGGRLA